MSDDRDRITETRTTEPADAPPAQPTHTTVIERRGGGGGLLIGLAVLIVVIVGAFFLFNQSRNDTLQTEAVTTAADQVGDAAKQVGDWAEQAADSVTKIGRAHVRTPVTHAHLLCRLLREKTTLK